MNSFNLKKNLDDVYGELKVLDNIRRNGSTELRMECGYHEVIFDNHNTLEMKDINRIFDESIFVLSQVDKISVEDVEMLGKVKDICTILNSCGKEEPYGYYSEILIAKNDDGGKFKVNISTSTSTRRDLLDILNNVRFTTSENLTYEENQKLLEKCQDVIHQIKLNTLNSLIETKKNGKIELYTGKENGSLYAIIEDEFMKGQVSKPVDKILSNPLKLVENYSPIEIKALLNIVSTPKVYKKALKGALAQLKKEKFRRKVDGATAGVKSKVVLAVALPIMGGAILSVGHHGGVYLYRNYQEEKNVVTIERNIEDVADFHRFKFSAINVEESNMDDSYYVEVLGFGARDKDDENKLYSIAYKIDKELYNKYYKYFDVEFKSTEQGIEAVNKITKGDLNIIEKIKANRAEWETMNEVARITEIEPEDIEIVENSQEK